MSNNQIIRAWKDAEFRESLNQQEKAVLPGNPAGLIELNDSDLDAAAGGRPPATLGGTCEIWTFGCCGSY